MTDTATCPMGDATPANLVEAVAAGQVDQAQALLKALPDDRLARHAEARAAAVKLHLLHDRWDRVAALLNRVPDLDPAGALTLNLARNMAAVREHRPAAYPPLRVAATGRYRFANTAPGKAPTIADMSNPARPLLLSAGPDPVEAARGAVVQIQAPPHLGAPVGLLGIGDGYLLNLLARNPPALFMDQAQTVHVIEPDAELARMCMMLHDYTGPLGPIEQDRFQWHVGPEWKQTLREALLTDLSLPAPLRQASQGSASREIAAEIDAVLAELARREDAWKQENEAYYASIDPSQWIRMFGDSPPRKPRVLLLTTRFSTVLQYATRDAAEGFRRIGWEARVLIEKSAHHRHFSHTIRAELADFKPDLVFQIDHQRHEQGDMIPAELPFACWVQDLLPHLTSREAGAKVGKRDFVLAFNTPSFIEDYDYPTRQCIDMPMMLTLGGEDDTSSRSGPGLTVGQPEGDRVRPRSDLLELTHGEDFAYVSNVSQRPQVAAEQLLGTRVPPEHRELMHTCFDELIAHYQAGGSYPSHQDIYQLFDRVRERTNAGPMDERTHTLLTQMLWNPMNIALYRQQALGWVVELARERGWSLGIYGRGWEDHPEFRPFARGVVEHGPALAALTRRTRINLNLEPYPCFTHHRLLDGLTAGGFFLVRRHPANALLQKLCNFLEDHLPPEVDSTSSARQATPSEHRAELETLLAGASCISLSKRDDPVKQVRCWQRAGVLVRQEESLPGLEAVSFDDRASLAGLVERYLDDPDARQEIAARQRASIEGRLTFPVAIARVVKAIGERLGDGVSG